jgi:ABC-type Fe3+-hydroxamate transport system substrate-binding protein
VDDGGNPISVSAPPSRIVSLIPATTELVFALGAGDRLVGRTHWCDYPSEASRVSDLGSGIGPNVEAVLEAKPDIVLLYHSSANAPAASRLRELGVRVLELRTDRIADLERVTTLLGGVLGLQPTADSLLGWIRQDLAKADWRSGGQAVADSDQLPALPPSRPPARPSVFILSWNRPPMTLGSGSFLSEIVERAGARNLFQDIPAPSAPISIEAVADRDPDFVLTAAVDLPEIATLPEWQSVPAVRERRFIRVEGSEFNRPSPRIGAAIRKLRAALDSARP